MFYHCKLNAMYLYLIKYILYNIHPRNSYIILLYPPVVATIIARSQGYNIIIYGPAALPREKGPRYARVTVLSARITFPE